MSDFLDRLIARTFGDPSQIAPRRIAEYGSAQSVEVQPVPLAAGPGRVAAAPLATSPDPSRPSTLDSARAERAERPSSLGPPPSSRADPAAGRSPERPAAPASGPGSPANKPASEVSAEPGPEPAPARAAPSDREVATGSAPTAGITPVLDSGDPASDARPPAPSSLEASPRGPGGATPATPAPRPEPAAPTGQEAATSPDRGPRSPAPGAQETHRAPSEGPAASSWIEGPATPASASPTRSPPARGAEASRSEPFSEAPPEPLTGTPASPVRDSPLEPHDRRAAVEAGLSTEVAATAAASLVPPVARPGSEQAKDSPLPPSATKVALVEDEPTVRRTSPPGAQDAPDPIAPPWPGLPRDEGGAADLFGDARLEPVPGRGADEDHAMRPVDPRRQDGAATLPSAPGPSPFAAPGSAPTPAPAGEAPSLPPPPRFHADPVAPRHEAPGPSAPPIERSGRPDGAPPVQVEPPGRVEEARDGIAPRRAPRGDEALPDPGERCGLGVPDRRVFEPTVDRVDPQTPLTSRDASLSADLQSQANPAGPAATARGSDRDAAAPLGDPSPRAAPSPPPATTGGDPRTEQPRALDPGHRLDAPLSAGPAAFEAQPVSTRAAGPAVAETAGSPGGGIKSWPTAPATRSARVEDPARASPAAPPPRARRGANAARQSLSTSADPTSPRAPRLEISIERIELIAEPPRPRPRGVERAPGLSLSAYLKRGGRR